jgi:hypothetical protein
MQIKVICQHELYIIDLYVKQQKISIYIGCPESNASYFVSWPVTKLGKWDFRLNKLKFLTFTYEVVKISDR